MRPAPAAFAQADSTTRPASSGGDYVSREEYDKLGREHDESRLELESMKRERAGFESAAPFGLFDKVQGRQAEVKPCQRRRPSLATDDHGTGKEPS